MVPDTGELLEQPGAGVLGDTTADGGLDVGDSRLQGAEQRHLGGDDGPERLLGQASGSDRCAAKLAHQLSGRFAAAVGVPLAERGHPGIPEMAGSLRGRVVGEERQGDRRGQGSEQVTRSGPVRVQGGGELVDRGGPGADLVITQPDQCLQFAESRVHWFQPAQPVPVGTQVVGQLVAVTGIGLGARGTPPGAGGVERRRMHRDDRVAGGEETVDNQTAVLLDDHGQIGRITVLPKPVQGVRPA